jgi:hypothetical protein
MKNKKNYGSQHNKPLNYILCLYFISRNSLSFYVCKKQSPNPQQSLKPHCKFF